jgi:FkbM family methyltransferase
METNVYKKISSKLAIKILNSNLDTHIPSNKIYKIIKSLFKKIFEVHLKKKQSKLFIETIGNFKLPFFKMGKINSFHLLGIDEIIIFLFYIKLKRLKFKRFADLGANIGLHSIILGILGAQVRAYEPDPIHAGQYLKNIKINKLKNIKLFQKAINTHAGNVKFTKIMNNTTGSFIGDIKNNTHGPIKQFTVKTIKFTDALKWAQVIKMDVEGMEAKLIKQLNTKILKKKIIILEIGTKHNARIIFNHCKKKKISIFSQKTGWKKSKNLAEVPTSYKEGSAIICASSVFPIT